MARIVTGGFTTFNLGTHLDPMTLDLYGLLEMFSYQSYTGSVAIPAYAGTNIKFRIDGNGKSVFALGSSALQGWRASSGAIQVGAFGSLSEQANGSTNLGFGLYENGVNTFAYSSTGDVPALYSLVGGQHRWFRATGSGTAGAAVTLVENGRFDSNGNLLIGRTAQQSGGKLEVAGNVVLQPAAGVPTLGANGDMTFRLTSNTSLQIYVRGSDGVTRSATLTLA